MTSASSGVAAQAAAEDGRMRIDATTRGALLCPGARGTAVRACAAVRGAPRAHDARDHDRAAARRPGVAPKETRGFLVFVPRTMRLPKTLNLRLHGRFRRRVDALWNGCLYVI